MEYVKTRRRSIRGRRSEIVVEVANSSALVIPAPLSDSIARNSAVDPVTELAQRKNDLLAYIEKLKAEKEEWDLWIERYSKSQKRAARKSDHPLERRPSARVPVDELGQAVFPTKPRYILHRVLRAFNSNKEGIENQRTLDNLLVKREAARDFVEEQKRKAEQLTRLLYSEPREELIEKKNFWLAVKDREEKRIRMLEENIARMRSKMHISV
ncbi:hypothetical protein Q1695_010073 [Nippostrongylus brasiliensis]|nr:hypothetical protein Q1695_010073 [Nippostrongylus brasiliensis]